MDIEQGIDTGLLKFAEKINMEHNLYSIVVISREGGFYETKGYYEDDTFMIKNFNFWIIILVKYFRDLFNIFKCLKFTTKSKDV
jgi:hypothetical protein